MKTVFEHRWDLSPKAAADLQSKLSLQVSIEPLGAPPRIVTGLDVAFDKSKGRAFAAAVSLHWPDLEPVESAWAEAPLQFPYVPGLLSFRECPVLLRAWNRLTTPPDLVFCDGQGIAHPRGLGLASHFGLLVGVPTVGVAKSRYVGEFEEPGVERGDRNPLTLKGVRVGWVLRTRRRVRPLFVSPGHLVSLAECPDLVLRACTRFRLPEPTRLADKQVAVVKRDRLGGKR